jgi:ATP-binding cassette subfamily B multidrug efflux pump
MEQGQIIESGNHQALVEKNGRYAKLWAIQTGQTKVKLV